METRVGTIQLALPRVRQGTHFLSTPALRRRWKQVCAQGVAKACVVDVSTRKEEERVGGARSEGGALDDRRLDSRSPYLWLEGKAFVRNLVGRGLRGEQGVISDAHSGLCATVRAALNGMTGQQPTMEAAREQFGKAAKALTGRYPAAAPCGRDAEDDVLA